MIRECREVRAPVWVDGPIERAIAAHPFEELLPWIAHLRLGGPMNHDHARALLHERIKLFELGIQ